MTGTATAYMVAPNMVALRFETGIVLEEGRTVPYRPEPGDRTDRDRLISRDGEPYGIATATPAGDPMVQTFDRFAAGPAAEFFAGETRRVLGIRLDFMGRGPVAHEPHHYSVTAHSEGTAIEPQAVWRKSKIIDTARIGPQKGEPVVLHDVVLELDRPLEEGAAYSVAIDHPELAPLTFTYDTSTLHSEAVHVSHIGFRPDDPVKAGWLSFWRGGNVQDPAADPAVDYPEGIAFRLLDVITGEAVFSGRSRVDEPAEAPSNLADNFNRADVHILDFSAFDQPGTYRLEVAGVGSSFPFAIAEGVWGDAFATAMQGFYHQRSGLALDENLTDWPRPRSLHPADGINVRQSEATLMDTDQGLNLLRQKSFDALAASATELRVDNAWGGWHDAGDWDRRAQHLQAAHELLDLAELRPDFAAATPLAIPEAGDAVPDLIDEALWAVDLWARLQQADGGVPGGIEAGAYPPLGETSWTSSQQLYVYGPDAWSSYLFAGTAARAAFVLAGHDADRAAGYAEAAGRAMRWAEANTPDHAADHAAVVNARNLAAAELFRLTGDATWHEVFKATSSYAEPGQITHEAHQFAATMVYAATEGPVDTAILERGIEAITGYADFLLSTGARGGFGQVMNPWTPYGWSYTSAIPVEADALIKAHVLTGEERYFEALIGETQFGLGANPDNMTFTTGLGHRFPREVLLVDKFGMGAAPEGLTVFGGWNVGDRGQHWSFEAAAEHMTPRYPDAWPVHETFIGHFWAVPITEYTIHGTLARVAKAWGYIAASDATGARLETAETGAAGQQRSEAAGGGEGSAGDTVAPGDGAAVLILPEVPNRGIVLADAPTAPPTNPQSPVLTGALPAEPLAPGELLDQLAVDAPGLSTEAGRWPDLPALAGSDGAGSVFWDHGGLLGTLLEPVSLEAMGPLG